MNEADDQMERFAMIIGIIYCAGVIVWALGIAPQTIWWTILKVTGVACGLASLGVLLWCIAVVISAHWAAQQERTQRKLRNFDSASGKE